MTTAITFEELLQWSDESTQRWLAFLAANPAVLDLPCTIADSDKVLGLVRHIVGVELRHGQRLAGLPITPFEEVPASLDALNAMHGEAVARLRALLADPALEWSAEFEFTTRSAGLVRGTRRKLFAHAVLHAIRHWAQLSTLVRTHGFPANLPGDLFFTGALK